MHVAAASHWRWREERVSGKSSRPFPRCPQLHHFRLVGPVHVAGADNKEFSHCSHVLVLEQMHFACGEEIDFHADFDLQQMMVGMFVAVAVIAVVVVEVADSMAIGNTKTARSRQQQRCCRYSHSCCCAE